MLWLQALASTVVGGQIALLLLFPAALRIAEAVDVAVAQTAPVDEFDAQLEGGLRLAHELVFVESNMRLNRLIIEMVAAPTPMVLISSDSTRLIP